MDFGELKLPISAVMIDRLNCDVLGEIPFCKQNDIHVHLKEEYITIDRLQIPYGADSNVNKVHHDIYCTESFILRNDKARVLLPGEFVEIQINASSQRL